MSELSAYEKMFEDGTAYKKIDMNKIQQQEYSGATASVKLDGKEAPLDDVVENQVVDDEPDWSAVDEAMQRRMNALKEKASNIPAKKKIVTNESKEIASLKKRVAKLEEALILVMETHEKLL